jgi:hypothetical protein
MLQQGCFKHPSHNSAESVEGQKRRISGFRFECIIQTLGQPIPIIEPLLVTLLGIITEAELGHRPREPLDDAKPGLAILIELVLE